MGTKIIYQGQSRKGNPIKIRYPQPEDAVLLMDFINRISNERTYIRFQGEQQTLESETSWLNHQIKLISENKTVMLVVEHQGRIIGNSTIEMRPLVENHIGLFGLVVAQDFRNEGIGSMLMEKTIAEAVTAIPELKIIELSVFANNPVAKSIYEDFGFREYGRLPEGILHRGEYIDHIYMFKKIR